MENSNDQHLYFTHNYAEGEEWDAYGGYAHAPGFKVKAGETIEVSASVFWGDEDLMPHDFSIVVWAEKSPVELEANRAEENEHFPVYYQDDSAKVPTEFPEWEKPVKKEKERYNPWSDIYRDDSREFEFDQSYTSVKELNRQINHKIFASSVTNFHHDIDMGDLSLQYDVTVEGDLTKVCVKTLELMQMIEPHYQCVEYKKGEVDIDETITVFDYNYVEGQIPDFWMEVHVKTDVELSGKIMNDAVLAIEMYGSSNDGVGYNLYFSPIYTTWETHTFIYDWNTRPIYAEYVSINYWDYSKTIFGAGTRQKEINYDSIKDPNYNI